MSSQMILKYLVYTVKLRLFNLYIFEKEKEFSHFILFHVIKTWPEFLYQKINTYKKPSGNVIGTSGAFTPFYYASRIND